MPDWRSVARSVAERAGIDPDVFLRQINQESGFNPSARSGAGAVGIAQIVPEYHPGVDPTDPMASLVYAANWMRDLYRQYGNWRDALAHYNGGGGAVAALHAGRPYGETVQYLNSILGPGKAEAAELDAPDTGGDVAGPQTNSGNPDLDRILAAKGDPVNVKELPNEVDKIIAGTVVGKQPDPQPTMRMTFRDGTYLDVKYGGRAPTSSASDVLGVTGTALASTAKDKPKGDIVGSNTTDQWIVRQLPDGTISRTPNPNYVKPKEPTKPAGTIIGGQSPTEQYIVTVNPDGTRTQEPNPNYVPPKPDKPTRSTHQIGGRVYTLDENGNVVGQTGDLRSGAAQEIESLDLAKKRKDLLPAQLQIIQGQEQTLQQLQGMYERGEIDADKFNAYMTASRAASDAALQGTTPFDLAKAEDEARRARQRLGTDILTTRITSGNSLASSLASSALSAAGHAQFRPGQTSLGVDPLALAAQYSTQNAQTAQQDPIIAALLAGAQNPTQPGATAQPLMAGLK